MPKSFARRVILILAAKHIPFHLSRSGELFTITFHPNYRSIVLLALGANPIPEYQHHY